MFQKIVEILFSVTPLRYSYFFMYSNCGAQSSVDKNPAIEVPTIVVPPKVHH